MADSAGDGPPNKRQKLQSPALTPSGSESEFNFLLDSIADGLPDELMATSDNSSAQNGTDPTHHNIGNQDSARQKHQQLSQLLSNMPTPASSANNASIGMSNALNNAVKSPMSNSLQSPPHGLVQSKPGPPTSSHFPSDNNTYVSSSASFSLANSTSPSLSSMSMPSSMSNMPGNLNMNSLSQLSVNNIPHPQNQMMNGPQYSMSGAGGVRQPQGRGMMMQSTGNPMQPQGMGTMGMSQQNMIGALSNTQMSRQPMDHAGMIQSSQQQLLKPNGPLGAGGGFGGYNQVQGSGHPLPVPTSNYNTNTNNNPSTVLSSMSSPPPHSMSAHNPNTQQVPQTQPVPHTGVPGPPGPPVQTAAAAAAAAQPQSADPEKRKLIQQQLVLLLHAHKCQRREQNNGEACSLPHCRTMKNVLNHMTTCNAGKSCQVAHCASSRQIITHWKNCTRQDCPVCLPLKHASDRQKQPGSSKLNIAFPSEAPGPQPATTTASTVPSSAVNSVGAPPAVPPPGMNDAQLEKAYAILGLPYNVKQTASLKANNPNRGPANNQAGLGLNTTGPTVPVQLLGSQNSPMNSILNSGSTLAGNDALQISAQTNRGTKEWHQSVTQDLRNHLVYKLVQAIFPTPDPAALKDRRMNNLVAYARKVDGDMYETANSREEYYHFLAEKIYKIQKELEKQIQRRELQKQQLPGDTTAAGIRPPTTPDPQPATTTASTVPSSAVNSVGAPPAVPPPGMNDAQLGLPYNVKQTASLQANNPNRGPANNQAGLGLNTTGPTVPVQLLGSQNNPMNSILNSGSTLAGNDALQISAHTNRGTKEWHQSVTQDLRNHLVYKFKRASQALTQNYRNIVDLSDVNRPTQVAENFSELYDNEWADAFEEVNNMSVLERDVIQLLLTIVQKSYTFCRQKATKQIEDIATMFESILVHGPDEYLIKECPPRKAERAGDSLLVQFRKGIAGEALQELTTGFFESVLYDICRQFKLPRKPKKNGRLYKYAKKVVELTWWMCVQDPPVYMCPPTIDGFNASIYRAYTKSRHDPDFFVWPALRLHQDGGLLLKGVVQFK